MEQAPERGFLTLVFCNDGCERAVLGGCSQRFYAVRDVFARFFETE